tara:strand:- start:1508 stop:1960 length:453 start_codon:yes stop_codon:yes gene_type:complete
MKKFILFLLVILSSQGFSQILNFTTKENGVVYMNSDETVDDFDYNILKDYLAYRSREKHIWIKTNVQVTSNQIRLRWRDSRLKTMKEEMIFNVKLKDYAKDPNTGAETRFYKVLSGVPGTTFICMVTYGERGSLFVFQNTSNGHCCITYY